MAPFTRSQSGPPEAFGKKEPRSFQRRDRMRAAGGMVCGAAAKVEGQRRPPGGHSQISFGGEGPAAAAAPPAPAATPAASGAPPRPPKAEGGQPKSYADMLAAQIEEKKAQKAAEKARRLEADREDDQRVQREFGDLKKDLEGEVAKQRQREQLISERQDSLSRFLAQQEGGKAQGQRQGQGRSASPAPPGGAPAAGAHMASEEDHLEARRRAVPGLCGPGPGLGGKPPTPPHPASRGGNAGAPPGPAAAGARCPSAGRRSRSTPPPRESHAPFAMDQDKPAAQPAQPQPASRAPCAFLPGRGEEAPRSGVSANVWASGANQNCGNFISERPTSRVLQPPGGGSSFQLG